MIVQILLFIINIFMVNLAVILSFLIRYGLDIPESNLQPYKDNFVFLTFIYMLAFFFTRVFKNRFKSYWDLFRRIFVGMFLGTLFGLALVYVFRVRWSSFPSSIFAICFVVGVLLVFWVNVLILRLAGKIRKKVIIIGKENIDLTLESSPLIESKYVDSIEELLQHEDTDELIICKKIHNDDQLNFLIYLLLKLKVNVVFSPAIYAELLSGNMTENNTIEFLTTFLGRKSDWEEFLIRSLDIVVSLAIMIITAPLMAIVSALIKLSSPGPIFYKQERAGKDGKIFVLYKFRTMVEYAEEKTGPVLAREDDSRITPLGRFLRKTRIDELPQTLNILRGDMSLVGPRPERPHFAKLHKALRGVRLAVKPGLTGLAQVRSYYDLKPQHKIKYDYLYIQRRSLLLNLYLLVKTIPVIFSYKGQ